MLAERKKCDLPFICAVNEANTPAHKHLAGQVRYDSVLRTISVFCLMLSVVYKTHLTLEPWPEMQHLNTILIHARHCRAQPCHLHNVKPPLSLRQ
jgi:hypothetical protein